MPEPTIGEIGSTAGPDQQLKLAEVYELIAPFTVVELRDRLLMPPGERCRGLCDTDGLPHWHGEEW